MRSSARGTLSYLASQLVSENVHIGKGSRRGLPTIYTEVLAKNIGVDWVDELESLTRHRTTMYIYCENSDNNGRRS